MPTIIYVTTAQTQEDHMTLWQKRLAILSMTPAELEAYTCACAEARTVYLTTIEAAYDAYMDACRAAVDACVTSDGDEAVRRKAYRSATRNASDVYEAAKAEALNARRAASVRAITDILASRTP